MTYINPNNIPDSEICVICNKEGLLKDMILCKNKFYHHYCFPEILKNGK